MSKLKKLLPSIFVHDKQKELEAKDDEGRLETDALPVCDSGEGQQQQNNSGVMSITNTPTASAELTESVVRELSDPNYNSLAVVDSANFPATSNALVNGNNYDIAAAPSTSNNNTMNTMNVHSAQQQVVMNFSNASNLHFGSVYNFNQNLSAGGSGCGGGKTTEIANDNCHSTAQTNVNVNSAKRQPLRKTLTIVTMMQSLEEPNHQMLDTVATHLGEGWKQVMRSLGHSEGQIEQAIIDHQMHGNIKEVIYQLLLQWQRNADDNEATVGRLTTLLWELNHRECVQRMKLVWKALEKRKNAS